MPVTWPRTSSNASRSKATPTSAAAPNTTWLLGQRRADAVRRMMTLLGVSDNQIETISFGKEKPKASGTSEADFAENRRADIVYQR